MILYGHISLHHTFSASHKGVIDGVSGSAQSMLKAGRFLVKTNGLSIASIDETVLDIWHIGDKCIPPIYHTFTNVDLQCLGVLQ